MDKREKLLLWGSNLWYFSEGLLGPLFAIFAERVGGDIFEIATAWATFLIVLGVVVIFVGKLADRYNDVGKAKIMLIGFYMAIPLTFCYIFVSNTLELFALQVGLGIAGALASPTWDALYDKFSGDKQDAFLWGAATGTSNIVTGVAVIAGGFIVANWSFELLFILMGTFQTIAAIYQTRIFRMLKNK